MSIELSPTTVSSTSEVIHITSQQKIGDSPRFVHLGSLTRGVVLGNDVESLKDPQGRRFQDVDVIDRLNILTGKYKIAGGNLDALHTRTLHPIEPESDIWGFYDVYNPEDLQPLATFPEKSLGLSAIHFCAQYPEDTIESPDPATLLALSNLYSHSGLLPKHQDQLRGLQAIAAELDPEFNLALHQYKQTIDDRYPLSIYMKMRKKIFDAHPMLALSIQDGALSSIGKTIHSIRNSANFEIETIEF